MRQFGGRANRVGPPTFGADPFSVLDSGAAHQSLPDASPPGFGGDPLKKEAASAADWYNKSDAEASLLLYPEPEQNRV